MLIAVLYEIKGRYRGMNWLADLYNIYDTCTDAIGDYRYAKPLTPIFHSYKVADLTVELDKEGNFRTAMLNNISNKDENYRELLKDWMTIYPVTTSSDNRTGVFPHPLCDLMKYTAGDMVEYTSVGKYSDEPYRLYKEQLGRWADSEYSTPKIKAIYKYIEQGKMIKDLLDSGVLKLDKNGKLSKKADDLFVRFAVVDPDDKTGVYETWKDKELFDKFIEYTLSTMQEDGICDVTGTRCSIARLHPSKILNNKVRAKLVSGNAPKNNFVWSGRFSSPTEAVGVSTVVTQKAHAALRWLVANQGRENVYTGDDVVGTVFWSNKNKDIPTVNTLVDNTLFGGKESKDKKPETLIEYVDELHNVMNGYRRNLEIGDTVTIMLMESISKGRISLLDYTKLEGSQYLTNIENWYTKCSWENPYGDIWTPTPKEIIQTAYGMEDKNSKKSRKPLVMCNEGIEKKVTYTLLTCIAEGKRVPQSLVKAYMLNISKRVSFESYNFHYILSTACAVIRAYLMDKGVDTGMELSATRDRSYLYGRLLAVAEEYEKSTFTENERYTRKTKAEVFWNQFMHTPAKTWGIISARLNPYRNKAKYSAYYDSLLSDIHSQFESTEDFLDNKPLTELFVLGYWCQKKSLHTKKDKKEDK